MIVLKFGGTSVEDATAIRRVTDIVSARAARGSVVVVSACAGVTNALLQAARLASEGERESANALILTTAERHLAIINDLFGGQDQKPLQTRVGELRDELLTLAHGIAILGELTPRSLDLIASYGERLSSLIIATFFTRRGLPATLVDARSFMITDAHFTKAVPHIEQTRRGLADHVAPLVADGAVVVTQGFVGSTSEGVPTTIGRGGSDYSAALIGALLNATEIQIWTDVDGILTADPTLVPEAKKIKIMSFAEASELAYFGARVLHPETILPAVERSIPVRVLNSRNPNSSGTLIVSRPHTDVHCIVKSVAYKEGISLVSIVSSRMFLAHGFLENVFDVFHKYKTVVHTVATSDVSISVTVNDTSHLAEIADELRGFASVTVNSKKAIVCVVGDNLRNSAGVAARILNAISEVNINMISQGASEINISFVIDEASLGQVVRRLHEELFRDVGSFTEVFS